MYRHDQQINDSLPVLVATAGLDGYDKHVNAAFKQILIAYEIRDGIAQRIVIDIHRRSGNLLGSPSWKRPTFV